MSRREPAALLPVPAARLIGFVLLAALGAAEWARMVAGLPLSRPLLWVALGAATGAAIWACERLPRRWAPVGRAAALVAGLALAFPAAGL
ncbi:MAG TPA: hypothetical protein VF533_19595, partial [Solirubrobacteraceae bacterium]